MTWSRRRPAVRRRIGLAGQYAAVDANLTGRENLRMVGILGQLPTPEIMPRAAELLAKFDLTDAADRPLRTYSGGMRRRLDIAASLVTRPPVLFLDEPTTGLDLTSRNALWETIEQLVEGRHDRPADHAVPGGGRPARGADRRGRRRPGDRERHADQPEVAARQHGGRDAVRRSTTDPSAPPALLTGNVDGHVERDDGTIRITSNDRRADPDRRVARARRERHRARHARRPRAESGRRVPVADRPPRRGRRTSRASNRSRAGEEERHEHCPGGDRAGRHRSADPDGTRARHHARSSSGTCSSTSASRSCWSSRRSSRSSSC